MTINLTTIAQFIQQFGLPLTIFIVLLWGGLKELWVFGWLYKRECARADRFEALALDLLHTTKRAVAAAEHAAAGHE